MGDPNQKDINKTNSKRQLEEDEDGDSSSFDEGSEEEQQMDEEMELGENEREIQVDFEGQIPYPEDSPGIKSLLHQLFLKAHINLSSVTNLILDQSFIGSVLKVSLQMQLFILCM